MNTPEERLLVATKAVKEAMSLDVEPEELAELIVATEIDEKDAVKLAKIVTFIKQRFVFKKSRREAFREAFPERCVPSGHEGSPHFKANDEKLSSSSIDVKAKRLENTPLYKKVLTLLQTNLYISYALSRMEVLDIALDKIKDPYTQDRDKVGYMKVFLEETRKPENVKGMEVNVNLQQNNVSLNVVEEKLSTIADRLVGANADHIIEALNTKADDDSR
jgi:hypothetical protein